MNVKSPCDRSCPNRSITCHGECKDYIEWAKRRAEVRAERYKRSRTEAMLNETIRNGRRNWDGRR